MGGKCVLNERDVKDFLDSKIMKHLRKKGIETKYYSSINCRCDPILKIYGHYQANCSETVASMNINFDNDVDLEKTKEEIMDAINSSYGQISGWGSLTWNNHRQQLKDKNKLEKEEQNMGLKIKKIDVLTIEGFKENTKAYDEIKINIDDDKLKKFEEEYGVYDFTIYLCKYVKIGDSVIEFLPKALNVGGVHCVPYEFIENIECTYYLETGK